MNHTAQNIDPQEIHKFDSQASRWWDPGGAFKPLHDINPLRLEYIDRRAGLQDKAVVDVGCGGGLLTEGMARRGARVTGIDMSDSALTIAKIHLLESGLEVDYHMITAEDLAAARPGEFDVVTCLEMLEHVPDPASVVQACADLVRPGGQVFFSTLNRNLKAYLFAVIGAEYLLKLLPRRTHDYDKFIRPSELAAWCRNAGLSLNDLTGLQYNPVTRQYSLGRDFDVNYLACATRE